MTRINLIDPSYLTDQHLRAEYKELTQVFGSLKRTLASKKGLDRERISNKCPLNGGHVYFFYDKLKYLQKRYLILAEEMKKRGFTPTAHITNWGRSEGFPEELYNDYIPTIEDKELLKERILSRINQKPDWYLFRSQKLNPDYFRALIMAD